MPSGKLCYLDFGMVSYVESSQRLSIIEAVVHLVNRDFVSLANLYVRMGFIPKVRLVYMCVKCISCIYITVLRVYDAYTRIYLLYLYTTNVINLHIVHILYRMWTLHPS